MPPAPDPNIFGEPLLVEKTSPWVLGLERKGMDERKERAWVKRKRPYLFIEAIKTFAPPTCLIELARSPLATIGGTVGMPAPVLMKVP